MSPEVAAVAVTDAAREGESPSGGVVKSGLTPREIEEMGTDELLATYKRTGDPDLKWPLVLRYEGMVRNVALQVRGIYSGFAQVEDVVSEGLLALMSSIDKFDPEKGVKFETYASKRIRGMVIDLARKQDWLPRNVRRRAKEIDQATSELYYQLGRFPSEQEIANELGMTQAKYQKEVSSIALCNILSLDALFEEREMRGGRLEIPSNDTQGQPEAVLQEQELKYILADAVRSLRKNEQIVLSLYYEKSLNMKEIAQIMEVSEPRISQLHARAIRKLKVMIGAYMGTATETPKTKGRKMG